MKIEQKYISKNPYSRPGTPIKEIKAIVLHWTATPRGTPTGVYNWFEERKNGETGYGSAHFCIGINGAAYQYLPQREMAYHVGSRTYTDYGLSLSSYPNNCTIGIEMCHVDWEGSFTDETWKATRELTYALLKEYNLDETAITTHHDIVGWKDCPRWFVNQPEDFAAFKLQVKDFLKNDTAWINTPVQLQLRENPDGTGYNSATQLREKELVYILGLYDGWYKVKTVNDEVGWVYSKFVT